KEETIIPLIERYIASIPATSRKFTAADNMVRPVAGKKKLLVNKGKEKKSLIVAFYTGRTTYTEDMRLKMEALGEILNIRIIEELREKIQGIYGGGISTSLEKIPYSNYTVLLQLPCGPEKVDTLLKAVNKEFEYMVKHGPDQSYLDKVKQQWREQHKVSVKENEYWLNELLSFKFPGGDPKRFLQYEKYIDKLTVKDVQQAAELVLAGKNHLTAVLMPGE
ncbi:MAG: insulinase family protein, partial [Flavitalea sp.]